MMSVTERAPLPHLHLSEAVIALGAACFIGGMGILLAGPTSWVVLGVVLISVGFALGFVAGYYRACGNGACTPRDW